MAPRKVNQGARRRGGRPRRTGAAAPGGGGYWLFGQHSVAAALGNPQRTVRRAVCVATQRERLDDLLPEAAGITVETLERGALEALLPAGAVHQGLAIAVEPLPEQDLEAALEALGADAPAVVLVLDQVTDPQNVGAILRTAAAFGALGVVMQRRHSPPESAALAKAASGGLEHIPLLRETNLARALDALKDYGFWCLGLDPSGPETLARAAPGGRTALVLGAEGPGLRRLTAERCDALVRLPIGGGIESLNVAASAAIGLYELRRDG